MDCDDWGLSAEEFDFLEQDAIKKISDMKRASAASSAASSFSSSFSCPSSAAATVTASAAPGASSSHSPLLPPRPPPFLPPGRSPVKTALVHLFNTLEAPSHSASLDVESHKEAEDKAKMDQPKLSVKLFLHASGSIAAKFPYNPLLIEAIHRIPKSSWHAKERLWMFPASSLSTATQILTSITAANVDVQKLDNLVQRALSASASAPDLQGFYDNMPNFVESKLLPFQRDGVRFVLQHGGRALVADEMGLGKTLQAIAVAACIQDSWPVLVLTPSSLRLQWACMIQEWLKIPPSDILVVLSQYGGTNKAGFKITYSNNKNTILLDGVFNIISYDIVPKIQDLLLTSQFEIVIADESHFLKNPQAKRTTASLPILQRARYTILLSGTPALSRPIELLKQLEALYPDVYKNVHDYGNRYCKGGIFGMYQGASNHEELHNLMKATVMIRRLKKDVLFELPVKRRQQVFVDLNEKDMKQIRILFHELEVVKSQIQACASTEEIESLKLSQKNIINKIYTNSAEAKIPAVLDYLNIVIEAGCKFLIFAHHQPVIDSVHKFLLKKNVGCIRIDGGTSSSVRQSLVNDFQEKEFLKAAVLSIKAGGVGLTLTAASTVIFAELSWNPGDIIQAEDRAHRIGQASAVNVYYLLANDTIDDIMWDVIHSKLDDLGQVLDGHEKTLEISATQKASPSKQKASPKRLASPSKHQASPSKQATIDTFLKRCQTGIEDQPKFKIPRN